MPMQCIFPFTRQNVAAKDTQYVSGDLWGEVSCFNYRLHTSVSRPFSNDSEVDSSLKPFHIHQLLDGYKVGKKKSAGEKSTKGK